MKQVQWDKVRAGSKVTLPKDSSLKSFNDEIRLVNAGSYFITGFWVDICGLNRTSPNGTNEICIQSKELINFLK